MFKTGDKVKHLKTGGEYEILSCPEKNKRLEHCNEPFYIYVGKNSITWSRRVSEMEDGRFELIK